MGHICEKDKINFLDIKFNYKDCIYYSKEYASLYLNDGDEIYEFFYSEGDKEFYNIAIKRRIGETEYFDLETPYGYGGWFSNTDDKNFIERAVKKYEEDSISQNIVAEFIRFHPFNNFPHIHSELFDFFRYDRDVVVVDLTKPKEERWKDYSSTTRNKIRKAEKLLDFNMNCNLNEFIELYKATMDKNKASDFYYFSKNYFENITNIKNAKLFCALIGDKMSAGSIFLESKYIVSYHLGAKDYGINILGANYFLFDNIFDYYSKLGKSYALLGGGRTTDKEDSLFKFKQKFSNLTLPFYIAGKIFNKEVYKYLAQQNRDSKLFLKWRDK